MLGFPASTEFGKRIPKQKFYENLDVSPALRRVFVDQIRLVYWRNKLAASTLNIAAGEAVTEIEVFEVRLNDPQLDEAVLKQIDKEIPYHILFILTCDGKAQAWIGYKEAAASGSNAFKVSRYYHTDWMLEDELHLSINGLNMDAIYESLVRQIAGDKLQADSGESLKESVQRDEKKKQLEKQIAALENKMRREKQLNRQMEMNTELKRLKENWRVFMNFAERNGFAEEKTIQIDEMDAGLRNRLFNAVHKYWVPSSRIHQELAYVVDRLGLRDEGYDVANWREIDSIMLRETENTPWYMPYEVIELIFEAKRFECRGCENYLLCKSIKTGNKDFCVALSWLDAMPAVLNVILEEEKSGYRLINEKFVNITNKAELDSLHQASNSPYHSVNIHIRKAISLYSDRKNPDYENSIKESISAVEAMCCTITGMTGSSATLGAAIKRLEDSGIIIHAALRDAFSKMYGYTSDSDGIRHGGIDFKNAPAEDAKYMLVSCSAFVNYLIEKHGKIGGTNE